MALPLAASSRLGYSTQWPIQQQQQHHMHHPSCLLQQKWGQQRTISSPCMAFWPMGIGRGRSGSAAGLHSRGYSPQLSASEISRGLTSNADLHLRQHYGESYTAVVVLACLILAVCHTYAALCTAHTSAMLPIACIVTGEATDACPAMDSECDTLISHSTLCS
jgi:hypothetical protein